MSKKIGVLTGGGDCPGLNSVIRAIVWEGIKKYDNELIGIKKGWKGLVEDITTELSIEKVKGIWNQGGTILETSRTNPYSVDNGIKKVTETVEKLGLDAIIAIGGDDTLGVGHKISNEGIDVVGVPKTIDNDVPGTDITFGFDTAINIATEAIDRLHTTAASHNRILIAELMGRYAGWITLEAGIAGGADFVLLPEKDFNLSKLIDDINTLKEKGQKYVVIAVSEGATISDKETEEEFVLQEEEEDQFGHKRLGGIGKRLEKILDKNTDYAARSVKLGHLQRGGSPSAFDRFLGTRYGLAAIRCINEGKVDKLVALKGTEVKPVPLEEAAGEIRTVPEKLQEYANIFNRT